MYIRFSTFPRTQTPPTFLEKLIDQFEEHSQEVGTVHRERGLTSEELLAVLRPDLIDLGFEVEAGKRTEDKIMRPVFFGENAQPELQYQVDAWHPEWLAGLEIEAGRAWMGNAVYRDLIQALLMVDMEHLILAVPQMYRYNSSRRPSQAETTNIQGRWLRRFTPIRGGLARLRCAWLATDYGKYFLWPWLWHSETRLRR